MRQSLPLRGNWDEDSASEVNSNVYQLLLLRTEDDKDIMDWLLQKSFKYTSPDVQNEILEAKIF